MKRFLFVLRNTAGKTLKDEGETVHFDSKMHAKNVRDTLNEHLGRIEWRVSRGPDNLKSAKPHSRPVSGGAKRLRGHHRYL